MQIFAFLALMSGGLSAHAQFAGVPRPVPAPAAAARAAASAEPPVVGPGGGAAAAALPPPETSSALIQAPGSAYAPMLTPTLNPVEQALPTGVIARTLKPHTAGLWVVDASGAADADSTALTDVLASARDGDVVFVRPGRYDEKIMIAGSITLRGTGADRSAVVINTDGPLTAAVGRGNVRIEHLTLSNGGSMRSTVLAMSGGALTLVDVTISGAESQALRVSAGTVDGQDVRLFGRIALIADASGRVSLTGGSVEGRDVGALITDARAAGEFIKTTFQNSSRQLFVQTSAHANVNGCSFVYSSGAPRASAIVAIDAAKVLISNTRIDLAHDANAGLAVRGASITAVRTTVLNSLITAVEAEPGSTLTMTESALEDNLGCALMANGSKIVLRRASLRRSLCGIGFGRDVTARIDSSRFEDNRLAPLVATVGDERTLSISGAGNFGAQASVAGLRLVPRAAPSANPAPPPPQTPPGPSSAPPGNASPDAAAPAPAQVMDPQSKPVLLR